MTGLLSFLASVSAVAREVLNFGLPLGKSAAKVLVVAMKATAKSAIRVFKMMLQGVGLI